MTQNALAHEPADGVCALFEAIVKDRPDEVRRLLAAGVSANARSPEGACALLSAISLDSVECVKALLAAGADPSGRDSGGYPHLVNARIMGVTQALIDAGADLNARTPSGLTLLDLFISAGSTQVVRMMLEAGVEIPRHMRREAYWKDLGGRGEPSCRVFDAHLMGRKIEDAMGGTARSAPASRPSSGVPTL